MAPEKNSVFKKGYIIVVVNGVVIKSEKEPFFKNSSSVKPVSLKGNIILNLSK